MLKNMDKLVLKEAMHVEKKRENKVPNNMFIRDVYVQ